MCVGFYDHYSETAWEYFFFSFLLFWGTPLPSSEPRRSDLGKNYRKPRLDYQLYIINMIINQGASIAAGNHAEGIPF